jgi:hypothetical protein
MGSPLYDLAVILHGDALAPAESTHLVETYLGDSMDAATRDTLHGYGCIYRYIELLWYLALDKPLPEGSSVENKLSMLDSMLA